MSEYFDSIAGMMLFDEVKLHKAMSLGVDYTLWPKCKGRSALEEYTKIVDSKKSHEFAVEKISKLVSELPVKVFRGSEQDFWAEYKEHLDVSRALGLAARLKADPGRVFATLEDFYASSRGNTRVFNLAAELSAIFTEHENDLESGKAVVKISNFEMLSEMIGGFNPGRILMLTAASGFGKTNLGINLCYQASVNMKCLYVNMEMSKKDFGAKFILCATETHYGEWVDKDNYISKMDRIKSNAYKEINKRSIRFTDGRKVSMDQLRSTIIAMKKSIGLDMVFVDYDQKLDLKLNGGEKEWAGLLRAIEDLEQVSITYDFCTIVFGQANAQGNPKASERSIQPLATLMHFHRNELNKDVYVTAKKNRFGQDNATIKFNYEPGRVSVTELEYVDIESINEENKEATTNKIHENWKLGFTPGMDR